MFRGRTAAKSVVLVGYPYMVVVALPFRVTTEVPGEIEDPVAGEFVLSQAHSVPAKRRGCIAILRHIAIAGAGALPETGPCYSLSPPRRTAGTDHAARSLATNVSEAPSRTQRSFTECLADRWAALIFGAAQPNGTAVT
jgi:hypothetical protein